MAGRVRLLAALGGFVVVTACGSTSRSAPPRASGSSAAGDATQPARFVVTQRLTGLDVGATTVVWVTRTLFAADVFVPEGAQHEIDTVSLADGRERHVAFSD